MERRKFVVGLGALASGSAAAMGTGAFTSVEADREATVEVVNDSNGYLSLIPDPEGTHGSQYVEEDSDGAVEFDFSSLNPDATTVIEDLIEVANSGTQEVSVTADFTDPDDRITLDPDLESGVNIGDGNSKVVDITFDTTGLSEGEYFNGSTYTITITAEATS